MDFKNMTTEEVIEKHMKNDFPPDFTSLCGIVTTELRPGYCRCDVDITSDHLNILNSIHGGLIFSLADTTAGRAAASLGITAVAMTSSISFLRPGLNKKHIYAEGNVIKKGRRVVTTEVSVLCDEGEELARAVFTNMAIS